MKKECKIEDDGKIDLATNQIGLLTKKFAHDFKKPLANALLLLDRIKNTNCTSAFIETAVKSIVTSIENNIVLFNELTLFCDDINSNKENVDLFLILNELKANNITIATNHSYNIFVNRKEIQNGLLRIVNGLFENKAEKLNFCTEDISIYGNTFVKIVIFVAGEITQNINSENIFYPFLTCSNAIIPNLNLSIGSRLITKNSGKISITEENSRITAINILLPCKA